MIFAFCHLFFGGIDLFSFVRGTPEFFGGMKFESDDGVDLEGLRTSICLSKSEVLHILYVDCRAVIVAFLTHV